ncbi:MAG: MerR family transcriptional regulator [Clostridiales bacterium]|nr:MerR family transcriptional regulator [Clostridiales bacterium]
MKIHEVAELSGVTVRTLQYYDQIGLLVPSEVTEVGYRIYHEEDLDRLQQILFFRELEFPLKEIKDIMNNPSYDRLEALRNQKAMLLEKRSRMDRLIRLVEERLGGQQDMSFEEFSMESIENHKKQYAEEVRNRWGDSDAYAEYEKKTKGYSKEDWNSISQAGDRIMGEFAKHRDLSPEDETVQELVARWQNFITTHYYECTKDILAGLGNMYVSDERFRENINKHGEGTADLMSKAIEIYCA